MWPGLAAGTYDKVMIDVTKNGGGYLDLGYVLAYCLTGNAGLDPTSPLTRPVSRGVQGSSREGEPEEYRVA